MVRAITVGLVLAICIACGGESSAPSEGDALSSADVVTLRSPEPDLTTLVPPEICTADLRLQSTVVQGHTFTVSVDGPGIIDASMRSIPRGWEARTLSPKQIELQVPLGEAGKRAFAVTVNCAGGTTVVHSTVDVTALSWSQIQPWMAPANGPRAREHGAMWIDATQPDWLYLYGGYLYEPKQYTPNTELWRLDLVSGAWTQLTVTGAPLETGGRIAPVADGSGDMLYYGGESAPQTISNGLYRLSITEDSAAFVALQPSEAPTPSTLGAWVLDSVNHRHIAVCGLSAYSLAGFTCKLHALSDTRGLQWRELAVAGDVPQGRYGFAYAYDAPSQRLFLFSGGQVPISGDSVNAADDTWYLDLSVSPPRWSKVDGATQPDIGRRNACWAQDTKNRRLFVWGGTADAMTTKVGLYVLELSDPGKGWQLLDVPNSPPARSSCSATYDAKRHRILFGFGNGDSGIHTDLWSLSL